MNAIRSVGLRIEFDLDANLLKLYAANDDTPAGIWDFKEETDGDAQDLEARVGYLVLGALSAAAGRSIGNRDYLSERNGRKVLILEALRTRLNSGESEAIVSMVLELVASARRSRNESDIVEADKLLRDAADKGNPSAIEYLKAKWETERHDAVAAIRDARRDGQR